LIFQNDLILELTTKVKTRQGFHLWVLPNPAYSNAIRSTTLLDSMRLRLVPVQIVSIPNWHFVHTVVPCILCTVHPQHKICSNIHLSAVLHLNFAGNCKVMASIWWTPVSPKSIFTARMSWSYNWARWKSGQIISVIESISPLTRRLSWYIFWFIIYHPLLSL
jgi:hypothetical protein